MHGRRWRNWHKLKEQKHVAVKHGVSPLITLVDEIPSFREVKGEPMIDALLAMKKGQKAMINMKEAGYKNIDGARLRIASKLKAGILKGAVYERQKRIYFERK